MADVTVKLKLKGIRELKMTQPITAELMRRGKRGLRTAGEGFEVAYRPGKRIGGRIMLRTNSAIGRRREAAEKLLARALDVMR